MDVEVPKSELKQRKQEPKQNGKTNVEPNVAKVASVANVANVANVTNVTKDVAGGADGVNNNNTNNNNNNDDTNKDETSKDNKKTKKRRNKSKKGSKKALELADPMKILSNVLEKSNYKDLKLSETVEKELYGSREKRRQMSSCLKDLEYQPTIGPMDNPFENPVDMSVLPLDFAGRVTLPPTAFLSLDCLYHLPTRIKVRWNKKQKIQLQEKSARLARHRQYLEQEQQKFRPTNVPMDLDVL